MLKRISRQIQEIAGEDGATAVEYALMIALIALAVIGAVAALGLSLPGPFERVSGSLSS